MIPMMPHIGRSSVKRGLFLLLDPFGSRRAGLEFRTKGGGPPLLCDLAGPRAAGPAAVVAAARGPVGAPAVSHRRHQRTVGADESLRPHHGPVLAVAVVVHLDGAGAAVARPAP